MDPLVWAGAALGAGLGWGAAWLWFRSRTAEALARAQSSLESQLAVARERAALKEQQLVESQETAARLTAQLREESASRATAEERAAWLGEARARLGEAFQALSGEALKSNSQSFLELARSALATQQESARGELEKRGQAIDQLVAPVRETLQRFDQRMRDLETARVGAYEGLTAQVRALIDTQKDLRAETGSLVKALGTPRVRGRWGEIQLRRVVEMAGMLAHCDFFEQQSATTEEGRLRPDLIVRLPGGRSIVVDAKAPLAAYLEALEAPDDAARLARMRDHARQIRDHISDLSRKSYWDQFQPAPEFVFLFLPGESFFAAALEQDPSLIELGVDQRVILATPTTLISLLKAVSYGWRQQALEANTREVSALGKELYKSVQDMSGHFAEMGRRLGGAVEHYNKTVASLESRVLVRARRFHELEAVGGQPVLPPSPQIEAAPRQLS